MNKYELPQRINRELQLKFWGGDWGEETDGNVVPVAILTKSLQHLQRAVHLLGMYQEGTRVSQQLRVPAEIAKRYRIFCRLPKEGSYVVPVMIGNTSHNAFDSEVGAVARDLQKLLLGIVSQDSNRINSVLPDHKYRTPILKAFRKMTAPKQSGIEIALQSRTGEDIFVLNDNAEFLKNVIKESEYVDRNEFSYSDHYSVSTDVDDIDTIGGYLIGIDFDSRTFRLHYPPTNLRLRCNYLPDLEEVLLELARELIHVTGQVERDPNGNPERMNNVEKVTAMDLSVIEIDGFEAAGQKVIARLPLIFEPKLDETFQYITVQDSKFGIQLFAVNHEELKNDIRDELDFLWRQYAEESDSILHPDALELKYRLREAFEIAQ